MTKQLTFVLPWVQSITLTWVTNTFLLVHNYISVNAFVTFKKKSYLKWKIQKQQFDTKMRWHPFPIQRLGPQLLNNFVHCHRHQPPPTSDDAPKNGVSSLISVIAANFERECSVPQAWGAGAPPYSSSMFFYLCLTLYPYTT